MNDPLAHCLVVFLCRGAHRSGPVQHIVIASCRPVAAIPTIDSSVVILTLCEGFAILADLVGVTAGVAIDQVDQLRAVHAPEAGVRGSNCVE